MFAANQSTEDIDKEFPIGHSLYFVGVLIVALITSTTCTCPNPLCAGGELYDKQQILTIPHDS